MGPAETPAQAHYITLLQEWLLKLTRSGKVSPIGNPGHQLSQAVPGAEMQRSVSIVFWGIPKLGEGL